MAEKIKKEKKKKSKVRKAFEWAATAILVVLVAGCSAILIYSKVSGTKDNPNAPTAIGDHYLPLIVQTDSMKPKYNVGTAIFVKKQKPEDIYNEYLTGVSSGEDFEIDLTFDDNYKTLQYGLKPADYDVLSLFGKSERTTAYSPMRTMTHRLFYAKINEGVELGQGKYYFFVSGINESEHQSQSNQYQIFTENELYGRVTGNSDFLGGVFSFATSPWGLIILLLIPCLYMIISSIIDLVKSEDEKEQVLEAKKTGEVELSQQDKERLKKELLNKLLDEKRAEKEKEGKEDVKEN